MSVSRDLDSEAREIMDLYPCNDISVIIDLCQQFKCKDDVLEFLKKNHVSVNPSPSTSLPKRNSLLDSGENVKNENINMKFNALPGNVAPNTPQRSPLKSPLGSTQKLPLGSPPGSPSRSPQKSNQKFDMKTTQPSLDGWDDLKNVLNQNQEIKKEQIFVVPQNKEKNEENQNKKENLTEKSSNQNKSNSNQNTHLINFNKNSNSNSNKNENRIQISSPNKKSNSNSANQPPSNKTLPPSTSSPSKTNNKTNSKDPCKNKSNNPNNLISSPNSKNQNQNQSQTHNQTLSQNNENINNSKELKNCDIKERNDSKSNLELKSENNPKLEKLDNNTEKVTVLYLPRKLTKIKAPIKNFGYFDGPLPENTQPKKYNPENLLVGDSEYFEKSPIEHEIESITNPTIEPQNIHQQKNNTDNNHKNFNENHQEIENHQEFYQSNDYYEWWCQYNQYVQQMHSMQMQYQAHQVDPYYAGYLAGIQQSQYRMAQPYPPPPPQLNQQPHQ